MRRYRNGQSSVAGLGVGSPTCGHGVDRVAGWRAAVQRGHQRAVGEGRLHVAVRAQQRRRAERVVSMASSLDTSHGSR